MKKENRKDDWYYVVRAVTELAAHVGSSKAWFIIGNVYFRNEKWLIDFPKKKISVSFENEFKIKVENKTLEEKKYHGEKATWVFYEECGSFDIKDFDKLYNKLKSEGRSNG